MDYIEEKQMNRFKTSEYLNNVLDSVPFGIYLIDSKGIIKNINKSACTILSIKEKDIIDKNAQYLLPNWESIFTNLKIGKTYENKEVVLNGDLIKGRYNISATKIEVDNEVKGMIIVFKEMEKIINIINKYSGRRAIYSFNDIIGESKEIKSVINYGKTISSSISNVLIKGEVGTGKEILAQAIHNFSGRKNKSFIVINCSTIPKSLIESVLFGNEEDNFIGNKKSGHPGKLEIGKGGTLFLEEIEEMPLDTQDSLVRALENGNITRIGGNNTIKVDVRIIVGTKGNIKKLVEMGMFREKLYNKISEIIIEIPPLRERTGDIPLLIKYFFRMKAKKLSNPIISMRADIYTNMINYNWPGNIRELENSVENIVNLNGEKSMLFNNKQNSLGNISNNEIKDKEEIISIEKSQKKIIMMAYNRHNGNISRTSKELGITRATLYAKLKKYEIGKLHKNNNYV